MDICHLNYSIMRSYSNIYILNFHLHEIICKKDKNIGILGTKSHYFLSILINFTDLWIQLYGLFFFSVLASS